jgi:peptide/nickel transport system substrate-binding protein
VRLSRISALLSLLTGTSACVATPRPADVVVFASGTDLESGNPLVTMHPLTRQVQRYALFTTLARYDSSLAPVPYLARAWEWDDDGRSLTMHLVPAVRWHDGRPTTAADVAFTILAARDPATGYPRAGDLAAVDTVMVDNDSTARILFARAQTSFPLVLCELPIAPAHLLAGVAHRDMRRNAFSLAPVGNGPFRFAGRVGGQRWVFERNDGFPRELGGPPTIAKLVVAVVDEPTTKFAGLASGELDFAGIAPAMASLAARDPTIRAYDYPVLFATALVLNTHRPPFDDVRVRQAIDASLDRERIVAAALAGYGRPAGGPVVPENPLAVQRDPVHDPGRADSLLDAAGWRRDDTGTRRRDGKDLALEMLTVGSGDHALEQLLQADLAARGVHIEIRDMEFGAFMTRARARPVDFDLLLTGISGDVSLAYLFAMYDSRQRGSALDYGDYHSASLDELFARARTSGPDSAPSVWRTIQDTLARELPAIWIYHARGLQGIARRMQGVSMDLRGEMVSLRDWHIVPEAR